MSKPISAPFHHPTIDETEQARRQREVDFAEGSVRYEGGILSDEIGSDELTAAILESRTARL